MNDISNSIHVSHQVERKVTLKSIQLSSPIYSSPNDHTFRKKESDTKAEVALLEDASDGDDDEE